MDAFAHELQRQVRREAVFALWPELSPALAVGEAALETLVANQPESTSDAGGVIARGRLSIERRWEGAALTFMDLTDAGGDRFVATLDVGLAAGPADGPPDGVPIIVLQLDPPLAMTPENALLAQTAARGQGTVTSSSSLFSFSVEVLQFSLGFFFFYCGYF